MANIDLTKYGITGTKEIVYNPSYESLYKDELGISRRSLYRLPESYGIKKRKDNA